MDSICEAIRESHIKINQMLDRNVSYLNCNGFVDRQDRVVKSKLFLYVVGSLPSRPEISAQVRGELNELNPRYSNYPALAIPIGAVAQANDMQLSRDCLCEVRRDLGTQCLDGYESADGFTPVWATPQEIISANLSLPESMGADNTAAQREARVAEIIARELMAQNI